MTHHLNTGDAAPQFELQDASGQHISSADFAGRSLIIYFYPKAATPGCTTEACDFRDNLSSLQSAGYQVIGISPDDPAALSAFAEDQSLTFPLLSDPGNEVARTYGAYGEKTLNGQTFDGTLRSTFVVDPEGRLRHVEYDVGAEGHVAALREALGV